MLLVDDDVVSLEAWALLLAGAGAHVEVAPSADACLRIMDEREFDLLVIDFRLGADNGLEVIRRLWARGHAVPFMLVTGHASVAVTVEAMRLGARTVLEKPLVGDDFVIPVLRELQALETEALSARMAVPSVAHRWAKYVLRGARADRDLRTLDAWAREAAVSRSALVEACRLCGIQPRQARDFMRLLRLALLRTSGPWSPEAWLDIGDSRTARALLDRGGVRSHRPTVEDYLRRQRFVATANPGLAALRTLLTQDAERTSDEN